MPRLKELHLPLDLIVAALTTVGTRLEVVDRALPADATCAGCWVDHGTRRLVLQLHSATWPEVGDGSAVPVLDPPVVRVRAG